MSKNEVIVSEQKQIAPESLIRLAIENKANLTELKEVLELQERWEANEAKKAYNLAMSAFKADPPKIDKDKKVGYDSSKGGRVGYKHASLYNVTQKISAALSKHGLSAQWKTNQSEKLISVTTTITHRLGHSESTILTAEADSSGNKNPIQAIGSTVTYLERYGLLALTGLATFDSDDDGAAFGSEFIDSKELNQILDMIAAKEADVPKFLEFLKIESLEKMPKTKFKQAMAGLESKKEPKR